jgi:hypothetical protein
VRFVRIIGVAVRRLVKSKRFNLAAALLLACAVGQAFAPAARARPAHTIDFHSPVSVGQLRVCAFEASDRYVPGAVLSAARGKILVPKDTAVWLEINFYGADHLDFIDNLKADDLDVLTFYNGGAGFEIDDARLSRIGKLTGLKSLNIEETEAGAATMAAVGKMTGLVYLNLAATMIKDKDLSSLRNLTQLRNLELNHNDLSDAALPNIAGLTNLRCFEGSRCGFSAGGMKNFAALKNLRYLNLNSNKIGDAGIASIPAQNVLDLVDISDCDAGNKALIWLSRFKGLNTIYAAYGHYSRDGLAALATLPRLNRLYVEGSPIKPEDLAVLKDAPKLAQLGVTVDAKLRDTARKMVPRIALQFVDRRKSKTETVIEIMR